MTPVTDGRLKELLARSDWDTLWYGEFVSIASELLTSRSEIARLTAEVERLRGEWQDGWVLTNAFEHGTVYSVTALNGASEPVLLRAQLLSDADVHLLKPVQNSCGWHPIPVRYREREVELIEPTKEPI